MRVKSNISGFSLVELMVVLSIISIVSGLALPKYTQLKIRAARVESQTMLNHIHTLQVAYHSEESRYGNLAAVGILNEICSSNLPGIRRNEIGFKVEEPCKLTYVYYAEAGIDFFNDTKSNDIVANYGALAFTDVNHAGSADDGLGFGIPINACTSLGISGSYLDYLTINQDRQFGFFNEGSTAFNPSLSDATFQCK